MATVLKITELFVTALLVSSPNILFGRDITPGSQALFSVANSEACIPGGGVLAGATVSVASLRVPENAVRAYERAEKALAKGKLDDAERALTKAMAIYPNSPTAWCLMGTVHEEKLQLHAASGDYSRALAADPRMLPAYLGLARIAYRDHKWQDVAELTHKVLEINALAFPVASLYNAVARLQIGDLRRAEKSARRFLSLDTQHERPQAYLLLADILTAEGDYAGAADEEKLFLTIFPNPSGIPNGSNAESIRQQIKSLEARSEKARASNVASAIQ